MLRLLHLSWNLPLFVSSNLGSESLVSSELCIDLCDEINASRIVCRDKHIAWIAAYFSSDRKGWKDRSGSSFALPFDLRSSNYIDGISFHEMFLSPSFTQLEYSILPERPRFFDEKLINTIFSSTKQIKMNFRRAAFNKHHILLKINRHI